MYYGFRDIFVMISKNNNYYRAIAIFHEIHKNNPILFERDIRPRDSLDPSIIIIAIDEDEDEVKQNKKE